MLSRENHRVDGSLAPNPTRLNRLVELDVVDAQRHVFCVQYEHCLDEVIEQKWMSWTCRSCPQFITSNSWVPSSPNTTPSRWPAQATTSIR